ncbi:MAG TPA: YicC/YloC family endoribonuclease [Phnomibacter sp.]|nr:YicC/YloC family endoribonuclease [Phnomibacter sp.]
MENVLYSMTGFGRAESSFGENQVLVEIKSLNGKQFDMNLKMPPLLKSYEFDIRNLVAGKLQRGSVDCSITLKMNGASRPVAINPDLIRFYYQNISGLAAELNLDTSQVLGALLKLPEVVTPQTEVLDEESWKVVLSTIEAAANDVLVHRQEEGSVLKADIESRIKHITRLAEKIAVLAPQRQVRLKESIERKLEEWVGKDNIDANRLEQELIYYIEKIDISEEQVRLNNHCDYFFSILAEPDASKGKKLGFILQEIGREINTTGSKANDAEIQQSVVLMKDELEKAKEQVLNIL